MARKPSKKVDAAAELVEKLLRVLRSQRGLGAGSYPLPVRRLVELTDPSAPAALVKKALNKKGFLKEAVPARAKAPDAPVALAADLDMLAGCPLLLEFLLRQARTPATQAFSVAALKKNATGKLQKPFQDAVNGQATRGTLPPTVAFVSIKGSRMLFLLSDLSGGQGPPKREGEAPAEPVFQLPAARREPRPPELGPSGAPSQDSGVRSQEGAAPVKAAPAAAPADFPAAFQQAFDHLDRQGGGHNFVSLIALRKALPVGREPFDRGLRELRQAGAYTLSAAEGRDGISPEEREAGIAEEGSLLLFVSRNRP